MISSNSTTNWWEEKPSDFGEIEPYATTFDTVGTMVAILSTLVTGAVILTMFTFPSMIKKKSMNLMVLFMSIGDFIWALACTFGFPDSGSVLCEWQGALLLFGIRTSWTWAVFMLVQLDGLVYTNALRISPVAMHIICWSLNIGLQCLPPILDVRYGVAPFFSGLTICTTEFEGEIASWQTSVYACFIGPMFVTVIIMMVMFIKIYVGLKNRLLTASANRELIMRASMYPAITFFSWAPIVATTLLMVNTGHTDGTLDLTSYAAFQICIIFATGIGGGAFGILYFFYLPEASLRWRSLFRQWKRDWRVKCKELTGSAYNDNEDGLKSPLVQPEIVEDFKDDVTLVSGIVLEEDIERRSHLSTIVAQSSDTRTISTSLGLSMDEITVGSKETVQRRSDSALSVGTEIIFLQ